MPESQAISPEIRGLFDSIKTQAQEYTRAFEYLESKRRDFESGAGEIKVITSRMLDEVHSAINEMNKNCQDSLNLLESKSDKIIKIYNDLDNIKDLKSSLLKLQETIRKQAFELESTLHTLKLKTDVELDSTLSSIKSRVDKELEIEIQRIEVKLSMKLKQMENRILNSDQKILSLGDAHLREFNAINDDIALLKKSYHSIRQFAEEEHKAIENRINEARDDLSRKIEIIDALVLTFDKDQQIKSYEKAEVFQNQELDNEINSLKRNIQKSNLQIDELIIRQSVNHKIYLSAITLLAIIFIAWELLR